MFRWYVIVSVGENKKVDISLIHHSNRCRYRFLVARGQILQMDLFSRVAKLQEEGIEPSAVQLELKME